MLSFISCSEHNSQSVLGKHLYGNGQLASPTLFLKQVEKVVAKNMIVVGKHLGPHMRSKYWFTKSLLSSERAICSI